MRAAVIPMLSCLEFPHFKLLFSYFYTNSNWSFLAFLFSSKIPFFSLAHRIKTPSHFVFSLLLLHMVLTTFCQLFFCILFPICSFLSISSTKNSVSDDCNFNTSIQLQHLIFPSSMWCLAPVIFSMEELNYSSPFLLIQPPSNT